MNAIELADVLESDDRLWFVNEDLMVKTCAMLRQQQAEYYSLLVNHDKLYAKVIEQQAEIESLKQIIDANNLSQKIGQFRKALTDEEIEEVYRTVEQDFALTESKKSDGGWRNFPVELGRAILRKAQEK